MTKVLVTGAAGFIGAELTKYILHNTDWDVVALIRENSVGTRHRLYDDPNWEQFQSRVKIVWCDLKSPVSSFVASKIGKVDIICHLAAQTHVDFSIADPVTTIHENVMSTTHLLEFARTQNLKKFLMFSTDEVYGDCPEGAPAFTETDRPNPKNPYSASKEASEAICNAYQYSYGVPVIVVNCMNVYGTYQCSSKFPILVVKKVLAGDTVDIHSDAANKKSGSRMYIHSRDCAKGALLAIEKLPVGERLNIVGEKEIDNLTLAQMIADAMGKPLKWQYLDFRTSPKGTSHDIRYHNSGEKLWGLGFTYSVDLKTGLEELVKFYIDPKNKDWLA